MENNRDDISEKKYSTWTHFAFNMTMIMLPATYGMFSTQFFWFYETEILLPVIFISLAQIIFIVWDAFNDPLIGYLSDRPNKFTRKYGRRFPFIMIMSIPTMLSLILLFTPPTVNAQTNPWPIFIWILIILAIHEFGYTSVSLVRALYPEKFRSDKERKKNSGISIITYNIGLFLGFVIPFGFIVVGDQPSYWIAATILMVPCLIFFLLGIPAIREDKEMIERNLQAKREPFFATLKSALKRKNFIALAIVSISTQAFAACIMGSINYWVNFVLVVPGDIQLDVIIMIVWLLMVLASMPFWLFLSHRIGNKKLQLIALIATICSIIPFIFARDLISALISISIIGFTTGGTTFIRYPIFGDLIDEVTILDKKRQEGVYQGVFVFFDRIGILLQPIIFAVVHILTNFDPESTTQTSLAQQGIIAAATWIPGIVIVIAGLIFWKVYDLTLEKTLVNKNKLKELGL